MAKNTKQPEAKGKDKKENFFVRRWRSIRTWCHDMRVELKKVRWPSRKETIKACIVVAVCVLAIGVFIWVFDAIAAALIKAMINLTHG